jgi:hypothetical protein
MQNIKHIVEIEAGLRAGKEVHFFPGWYAVWNEQLQRGVDTDATQSSLSRL